MSTVMKTTRDVRGVGLSIPRPDGPEKVTGHVQYVADIKPKGLLHAKLLRSPHAHARIRSIDVSAARALPGVHAILTGRDLPEYYGIIPWTEDEQALCEEKARYVGDAVAAAARAAAPLPTTTTS